MKSDQLYRESKRINHQYCAILCILAAILFSNGFVYAQPESLREDITITEVFALPNNTVRIAQDPTDSTVYIVCANGRMYSVGIEAGTLTQVYSSVEHGLSNITGFTISEEGAFFLVSAASENGDHVGIIKRGKIENDTRVWTTLARTEPYQPSGNRDHLFNAIEVTPDGQSVIVNSGSRSDHGEMGNGGREFSITSAFFKLPVDGQDILLENDSSALEPYLFADGLRNSYDMAFSSDGELFATENCGARDDPEELNWIREGHHYGFPWRMSTNDNPQQFADFDPPESDPLIVEDINMEDTFYNDPTFPPKPDSIEFTDPVLNVGPDADHFRDTNGLIKDASDEGRTLGTFTPHSSPLAIVFDRDSLVSDEFAGDCFVMSYNDASLIKYAPFDEPGEDLLHVELNKIENEERYEANITRIAQGFYRPVDALMIGNKIYVIEYIDGSLWEVTLPSNSTSVSESNSASPDNFLLLRNYPNPFNPLTKINYTVPTESEVTLTIHNIRGELVKTLINNRTKQPGKYSVNFDGSQLSSGVYIGRLRIGTQEVYRKMTLIQ